MGLRNARPNLLQFLASFFLAEIGVYSHALEGTNKKSLWIKFCNDFFLLALSQ